MLPERVLVVHNAYQQRGGEDSVVADEVQLLRGRGHTVRTYLRDNDDVARAGRLRVAADALWSRRTVDEIGQVIADFRPAVVHVHNTLPLISPSLYWACAKAGVPVVQTLHNFRLACPQAMFLRDGTICEDCLGKATPWPALRRGCYRESRAQTAVVVATLALHRGIGTYQNKISRFIALNEFCRGKFVAAGLPAARIAVKPNFVDVARDPDPQVRNGFLFVGRLAPEKGIDLLAEAWQHCGDLALRVAGAGASDTALSGLSGVEMLGALAPCDVRESMRTAMALVLPSIWYENFPRSLVEAFGAGLPVIASRIGALAELVQHGVTGLLFEPGDAEDFGRKVRWAAEHPLEMSRMGHRARARFEVLYTPEINYTQLLTIYRAAMEDSSTATAQ